VVAISAGGALKRRLMAGALRIAPDAVRRDGAGQMLGRVIESAAVEQLLLSGAVAAVFALVELGAAAVVLAGGAGGAAHVALLVVCAAGVAATGVASYRRQTAWVGARLAMTHDLVEQMVGHRTRLAQQAPEAWHDGEDQAVERALRLAQRMDRASVALALGPRVWLLVAAVGLAPAFAAGGDRSAALAIAVAGILLAFSGLTHLAQGAGDLSGAAIAWQRVRDLFMAAGRAEPAGMPELCFAGDGGEPTLSAEGVTFTHAGRSEPVLRDAAIGLGPGDRVLLEGKSGAGKSTFAAILAGLRRPDEGLVLVGGLDWASLGADGWRRRVVAAPQFHENHVITETLAFNLLLGRGWPPTDKDAREAAALCRELGLGELLERMPAGLLQMVGEGGWQLSHGEKSRVYMARALLQGGGVVILDESFGALDPETMGRALDCALARARTLVVIAHT
jgi:ATP-binding cassette subfamily B protein